MSSFDLREELEGIKDFSNYEIVNDYDVPCLNSREVDNILSRAVDAVSNESSNVAEDEILDIYRSVLKGVMLSPQTIPPVLMTKIHDSLVSAFTAAADDTSRNIETYGPDEMRDRRQILEIYAFLLTWFVMGAEKYKGPADGSDGTSAVPKPRRGRGGKAVAGGRGKKNMEWTWVEQIGPTLEVIVKVLKIRSQRMWTTTVDRETVVEALMGPVYRVMEHDAYLKSDYIREYVFEATCIAVKDHNHIKGARGKLMQLLGYSEGLADYVADLLAHLSTKYEHTTLTEEFLREVAGKTWASADSTGPKSFSRFLIHLAEVAPRLVLKELNALQNHLDNDAYQMRNAIVEIFGLLIRDQLSTIEDEEQTKITVYSFYDALLQRTRDTSSYVRARVFQVLAKVLDISSPNWFGYYRKKIIGRAGLALTDKTATVRKYAMICLQQLMKKHTYPIRGGKETFDLPRQPFKEQYDMFVEETRKHEAELAVIVQENAPAGAAQPEAGPSQTPKKKNRSKRLRTEDGDGMELDGEDGEEDDNDGDSIFSGDDEGGGSRKSKRIPDEDADSIISGDEDEGKHTLGLDLTTLDLSHLDEAQQVRASAEIDKITRSEKWRKYYADALEYIDALHIAMEPAYTLLGSKNKAEVLEAIELFYVAHKRNMSNAEDGLRKMIHLIWQKDNNAPPTITGEEIVSTKGVRNRLMDTYELIYFFPQKKVDAREAPKEVAKQLVMLTQSLPLAELTSLEELLKQMMDEDRVQRAVIESLWQLAKAPQIFEDPPVPPAQQRRGAIILLGMLALSKPSVVRDKLPILLDIGLGARGKADLVLAKYTCIALQRMTGLKKKVKGSLEDNRQRYPLTNPVFRRIINVLETSTHNRAWFAFAEQAINAIYALAEKPEIVAEKVIRDLTKRAFTSTPGQEVPVGGSAQPPPIDEKASKERDPDAMETDDEEATIKAKAKEDGEAGMSDGEDRSATPEPQAAPGPSQPSAIPGGDAGDAFHLSQMFFVVGHVAMKQLVHLELIEREMKRQKREQEQAAKEGATQAEKEDEIEQVAGNAEDDIGELLKHVREDELLYGEKSLLKVYGPLLVYVCGSPHIYKDATLRSAATLSFAKFLCVSAKFCESHHMLLFKILETSRDPNIRANIVIGIGDLAVSFATIIDERLNDLYLGLSADDLIVKKNTLMVLTHLILNGMIKVKGQLAEMAKCVEDGEERVSDLAKLFFNELSTKDNAIYNNLPDMISHLSMGRFAISEEAFQNTMRFIFGFIEKERQAENIIEKLCQRFKLAPEPRQWRDIAFCLSLLPFRSEKSMKKLTEGLPYYKDKLHDEGVYSKFQEILQKAKTAKKAAAEIDDFEKILDSHKQKGEEDQEFEKQVEKNKAKAKKRATKREKAAAAPAPATAPKRATRARRAVAVVDDEMDEDD